MKKVLLFLCAMLTLNAMALTYNVTVPEGTNACYIAGEMTGWSQQEMTKVDATHYTIDIAGAKESQGYKYCSGPSWDYVEKKAGGGEMGNRTYSSSDVVAQWNQVYIPAPPTTYEIPDGVLSFNENEHVVFFVNNKNWASVNAYVWTSTPKVTWPGAKMDKVVGVIINNQYEVYKYNTGQEYEKLIFNNGSAQTGNLDFKNGGVYDGDGKLITTIEPTKVVVPTFSSVSYSPAKAFVNEPVTFSAETLNADGLTVEYLINGEVVSNPWTPTQKYTYTLPANLKDGAEVVVTSEPQTIVVKEHTSFTVYLKKHGAWETTKIHYWGEIGTEWPGVAMAETTVDGVNYFYHTFEDVESISVIFNNKVGDDGEQTVNIENITENSFYELGEKDGDKYTVKPATTYDATITAGYYYLEPGVWESDLAWYAVYLFDNNNGAASTWTKGWLTNHYVVFQYTGATAYTHMIFCRMNPEYDELTWDKWENDVLIEDHVWNQTEDIEYGIQPEYAIYKITGFENDKTIGSWGVMQDPTALNRVELTAGIGYAYGVVSAEGAIEVYNVNGAVVARGNDTIDLRGLGRGVYIIRNGNQVRKVVR